MYIIYVEYYVCVCVCDMCRRRGGNARRRRRRSPLHFYGPLFLVTEGNEKYINSLRSRRFTPPPFFANISYSQFSKIFPFLLIFIFFYFSLLLFCFYFIYLFFFVLTSVIPSLSSSHIKHKTITIILLFGIINCYRTIIMIIVI